MTVRELDFCCYHNKDLNRLSVFFLNFILIEYWPHCAEYILHSNSVNQSINQIIFI